MKKALIMEKLLWLGPAAKKQKKLMRESHLGSKNGMYGKSHNIEAKMLQGLANKGIAKSIANREAMSITKGTPVYLYTACSYNHQNSFCFLAHKNYLLSFFYK